MMLVRVSFVKGVLRSSAAFVALLALVAAPVTSVAKLLLHVTLAAVVQSSVVGDGWEVVLRLLTESLGPCVVTTECGDTVEKQ